MPAPKPVRKLRKEISTKLRHKHKEQFAPGVKKAQERAHVSQAKKLNVAPRVVKSIKARY